MSQRARHNRTARVNKVVLNPQCGCVAHSGAVPVLAADVFASAAASAWLPSGAPPVWDASGCPGAPPLVDGVSGGTSEERSKDRAEQNFSDSLNPDCTTQSNKGANVSSETSEQQLITSFTDYYFLHESTV